MEQRDYYEVLGIVRNAGEGEIKKAYRKKAMEHHPDRNPGNKDAEENFKEAAEAYEVLSDLEKRGLYDRFGHEGLKGTGFHHFSGFEDIFSSFGDIFDDFFGFGASRRGRKSAARAGADLRYDLTISFLDAAFGTATEIEIAKEIECETCNGSGSKPGTDPIVCPTCQGRGEVIRSQGFLSISTTCPQCHGGGKIIVEPCRKCRGHGKVKQNKKISLKIPAGVDNGSRLRLIGEGENGLRGGSPGDLYVVLRVEHHDFFERENDDILCRIPISFPQAALGSEIEVPTLEGSETISIPPGTQNGEAFRLRGKGIYRLRGTRRGDQIVQVEVKIPNKLTKRQKELLRELEDTETNLGGKKKFWKK